jgi:catechol-2,3-dioxygenase
MTEATPDIRPDIYRTHLALLVRDPFMSCHWYRDVLGMIETARGENWVFMSFGTKHHDIALIRADAKPGEDATSGNIRMQHYGLEVSGTFEELQRLYGMLLRKNVPVVKATDHKVGYGVYFTDPDGYRFEFFLETVHDDDEGRRIFGEFGGPSDPIDLTPL